MDRIQLRRDTSERWKQLNPVLLEGEVAFETDTKLRKIGDGTHNYNSLDYLAAENIVQEPGRDKNLVMSQEAVTLLLDGYLYKEVAFPATNPGTPTSYIYYIATTPGKYIYFDNIEVSREDGQVALIWKGTNWVKNVIVPYFPNYEYDKSSIYPVSYENTNNLVPELKCIFYNEYLQRRLRNRNITHIRLEVTKAGTFSILKALNSDLQVKSTSDFPFQKLETFTINTLGWQTIELTSPIFISEAESFGFYDGENDTAIVAYRITPVIGLGIVIL